MKTLSLSQKLIVTIQMFMAFSVSAITVVAALSIIKGFPDFFIQDTTPTLKNSIAVVLVFIYVLVITHEDNKNAFKWSKYGWAFYGIFVLIFIGISMLFKHTFLVHTI